ncbi:hypothetical protein SAMN05660865_01132 [Caloramator fervidus]|uniref:Uncharacterized protein n=1 Tax=Caloramator fervidus TaxID=29344 RepID=A0A1H5V9I0_9CLOT|nr:hypothetical protein [Caloramator fervidus]SEF83854.1 hypothetical protein SAMN05660865_01132 [Caloramator fervidus]
MKIPYPKDFDIFTPEELGYPIIERTNNALLWPEGPKSGIDFEIFDETSVPENLNKPSQNLPFI